MKTVSFYFDFLSPFAYLASEQIEALCVRNGANVVFKPVLFAGLLNHWGQRGPAEIPPKALHTIKLCARMARLSGVPLRSPRYHPFRPLSALRVCLTLEGEERATAVHAIFRMGWAHGGDIGSDHEISAVLSAAGLDGPALLAQASDPALKAQLKSETQAAIVRGVFGIPTMITDDGELFWGLDQLGFLELHLQGKDPLAGVSLRELLPEGVGAWRAGAGDHSS